MDRRKLMDMAFGDFIEGKTYDKANDVFYELVRTAFKKGWEKGEEYAQRTQPSEE